LFSNFSKHSIRDHINVCARLKYPQYAHLDDTSLFSTLLEHAEQQSQLLEKMLKVSVRNALFRNNIYDTTASTSGVHSLPAIPAIPSIPSVTSIPSIPLMTCTLNSPHQATLLKPSLPIQPVLNQDNYTECYSNQNINNYELEQSNKWYCPFTYCNCILTSTCSFMHHLSTHDAIDAIN
jgi:hypothetical protein